MNRIYKVIARISLSIITLFIGFALLECISIAALYNLADEQQFSIYASPSQAIEKGKTPLYKKHRYLGYAHTENYTKDQNKHNSLGYRGDEVIIPKPNDLYRIVCMGGSTTYTSHVKNYKKSYPYLLQTHLNKIVQKQIDVINAGVDSWSSWETMINFQINILDLKPDMIIIYHNINDIHPRLVWPPSKYKGDNSGRRTTSSLFEFENILNRSTFIRGLRIYSGLENPSNSLINTIDHAPKTYYGNQFRTQKLNNIYPSGIFKEVSAMNMLKTNEAVYFRRNLQNIITTAKANKITVLISSFAYSPHFKRFPRVASPEYQYALQEHNKILEELSMENDVLFYNFEKEFPKDKKYYTDGRHLNESGSSLKAEYFAKFILNHQFKN